MPSSPFPFLHQACIYKLMIRVVLLAGTVLYARWYQTLSDRIPDL